MTSLIERIESVKGPSRELDEQIGMAIGLKRTIRVGHECLGNDRIVPVNCPYYTASIDAALTLADPAKVNDLMHEAWRAVSKRFALHIRFFNPATDGDYAGAFARAFVAAALRARGEQA